MFNAGCGIVYGDAWSNVTLDGYYHSAGANLNQSNPTTTSASPSAISNGIVATGAVQSAGSAGRAEQGVVIVLLVGILGLLSIF